METMNLQNLTSVYLLGIGGIGMSALARYFSFAGARVSGYDRTRTPLTMELEAEGIGVHYEEDLSKIPADTQLVIFTPAIPTDSIELAHIKELALPLKKRAEVLGLLTCEKNAIAVAGTHGKTTTSTLIAHLFKASGASSAAFLGGVSKNYNTNLLLAKDWEYVITEADEFDKSFMHLFPTSAVITSADPDHLDIYGSGQHLEETYGDFTANIRENGTLVIKKGINVIVKVKESVKVYTYSLSGPSDYYAENVRVENGYYNFDLCTPTGRVNGFKLGLPGIINVENSVAALAIALNCGVDTEKLKNALFTYAGVRRRFDIQLRSESIIYMDDYAHHPAELEACINSTRLMWPGRHITGIFQPHLFTRTRDFADGFAASLDQLDTCILLDIYPARELPIEGVNAAMILDKMKLEDKQLCDNYELFQQLKKLKPGVLLSLGAGNIDQLVRPIQQSLISKFNL
jgi:UDP-N-acetylmuramate--alanine ligase